MWKNEWMGPLLEEVDGDDDDDGHDGEFILPTQQKRNKII